MNLQWLLSRLEELSNSLPPFFLPVFAGSVLVGAALALLSVLRGDRTRYPKGPSGWPLLGNIRFGV